METVDGLSIWVKELSLEVEKQTVAVMELAISLADSARRQVRRDQAVILRILKSRVMKEVEDVKRMESASQSSDNSITLFGRAPLAFIFGTIATAAIRHKDAYKTGAKLAGSVLSKEIPFGTVRIAIGKEGLPEDLSIIPVSRFARKSNETESQVETSWRREGYLLMTPEQFAGSLDRVEQAVLAGSLSLPIDIEDLNKQIVEECECSASTQQ